jgi:hypothetical protein
VEDRHEIQCSKCHKVGHNRQRCEENVLRIDESLRYFTFDFIFLFLPCIMPHVFIYFIMHCVVYLYCIMFNVFVISHVLTQVFNIMQDGASVPTPGGEVR